MSHRATRLFAPLQERILVVTLLRPERAWYRSELARELGVPVSSLQRPLAGLVHAGALKSRQDGNRVYYQADTESPLFPELRGLLAKSSGLVDVLRDVLRPLGRRIKIAFIYGSVASGTETSASDIDLLVVGDTGIAELALPLRDASRTLGQEVNPKVYSEAEFEKKLASKNRFLFAILDKPKLFVVGKESDLGKTPTRTAG